MMKNKCFLFLTFLFLVTIISAGVLAALISNQMTKRENLIQPNNIEVSQTYFERAKTYWTNGVILEGEGDASPTQDDPWDSGNKFGNQATVKRSIRYVVTENRKIGNASNEETRFIEDQTFKISVFNISEDWTYGDFKPNKVIDVLALLKDWNKNAIAQELSYRGIVVDSETDEQYLGIDYYDTSYQEFFTVYMNLESEELTFKKKSFGLTGGIGILFRSFDLSSSNVTDIANKYSNGYIGQYGAIYADGYKNNWIGPPNSEELAIRLTGLENPFENVTLNAKYSKDGQPHTVNSYEELMTWFKE